MILISSVVGKYSFSELVPSLKDHVVKLIGVKPVTDYLFNSTTTYLCGGLVRSYYDKGPSNDADFYFKDLPSFYQFVDLLLANGYKQVFSTERAISFEGPFSEIDPLPIKVQAVRFIMGDVTTILDKFDFTITQCAVYGNTQVTESKFSTDIKSFNLQYVGSELPLSSLKRVIKYVSRGYSIRDDQLINICKDINFAVNFENQASVEYHIQSFDPSLNDGEGGVING